MNESLSENTQVKANLAFAIKLILGIGTIVWTYSVIVNRITALEIDNMRIRHEVEANSEFRVKWPRGELGALPADAEQNLRLKYLEHDMSNVQNYVDELRLKTTD
jgi:hypothetical protein